MQTTRTTDFPASNGNGNGNGNDNGNFNGNGNGNGNDNDDIIKNTEIHKEILSHKQEAKDALVAARNTHKSYDCVIWSGYGSGKELTHRQLCILLMFGVPDGNGKLHCLDGVGWIEVPE